MIGRPTAAARRAVAVLAVCAGLVAFRLLLAAPLAVPLQVDELGYLGNARYLATGEGLVATAGRAPYKVGYALLLAPAALLGDGDAEPMLRAAQALNALLAACLVPLGVGLAGRLRPGLGFRDRLLASTCVGLYPGVTMYATTAMAFTVLVAGFFAYLVLAWRACHGGTAAPWVAWGGLTGFLYLVHERTLGWLAVAAVAAALAAAGRRRLHPLLLVPAAALPASIQWLLPVPGGAYATGAQATGTVAAILRQPSMLLATASGQPWYLWLASGGVLAVGLLAAVRLARGGDRLAGRPLFWLTAAGSAASMVAISVLHMAHRHDPRMTHWIYGRYNESVAVAALLVAVVALAVPAARRRRVLPGVTLGALGLLAVLTVPLRLLWTPRIGEPFGFNAAGICLWQQLGGFGLLRTPLLGAMVAVLLAAAFGLRWRLGVAALGGFFAASTWAATVGYWLPMSVDRAREVQLAQTIARVQPEGGMLLYEARDWPNFHFYSYSYRLPGHRLEVVWPAAATPADGELLITSRRRPGPRTEGWRMVGLEWLPRGHPPYIQSLWVRPGPLADRLRAAGWLLPAEFPSMLPKGALATELCWRGVADGAVLSPGRALAARLELAHRGTTPWPHRRGWKDPRHTVTVVVRWVADATGALAAERQLELPRTVYPADEVRLAAGLAAKGDDGRPLPPGRYRVVAAVAQRDERRVPRLGRDAAEVRVVVRAAER